MPKPGGCHSSGISLGDALRLPKRHPAWRHLLKPCHKLPAARRKPNIVSFAAGRQCRWSTCMERENLAGDVKAQGAPTARPKVPMRRRGADCPVVMTKRV